MKFLYIALYLSLFVFLSNAYADSSQTTGNRPPQYIALAFDGSKDINMWQETRDFALESKRQGMEVKFTYFISGVYWLPEEMNKLYTEPALGIGKSNIGWGGNKAEITERIEQVNLAQQEGHELGSHANGHFPGASKWSLDQWDSEFSQFNELVFNVFHNIGISPNPTYPTGYAFDESEIVGFRAPLLESNGKLMPTLNKYHFRYDTSHINKMDYWPEKINGIWNFPLAYVTIAGTAMRTISMDYNFYLVQSGAKEDPENAEKYYKQMLQTYLNYFENNYNGNRAPIHIGHHFGLWNKGAYWHALKDFARAVCGLPEVKCVTYRELADYLDSTEPSALQDYRKGSFPKMKSVKLASSKSIQSNLIVKRTEDRWQAYADGELKNDPTIDIKISVNENTIANSELSLVQARKLVPVGSDAKIVVRALRNGDEVLRSSYRARAFGSASEFIDTHSHEESALLGDLPRAHRE